MKITARHLRKVPVGALVRVRWPDASAEPTESGTAEEMVGNHKATIYDTFGLYLGYNKVDVILSNDQEVDGEYRGKLNIPRRWLMDLQIILENPFND